MRGVLRALLAVAAFAAALPVAAFAQCSETRAKRPLFVASGRYEVPLREAGGVGILIPVWDLEYGDPGCTVPAYRGVLVEVVAGAGGRRVGVGLARRVKANGQPGLFGQDVLVSVLRTGASPRQADASSTYASAEAGLTAVGVRIGLGAARRLTSTGSKATIFIWSVGAQIAW